MSEIATLRLWVWRCTFPSCEARPSATHRTEDEARRPADEHARATGHRVAWGLRRGRNGLR